MAEITLKKNGVLRDHERAKREGGHPYSEKKLSACVDLWAFYCGLFGKPALIYGFEVFSGLTAGCIRESDEARAACTHLYQKLKRIQEGGLAVQIADGRRNPTGALACLNHWHGWTQSREIVHTVNKNAVSVAELPRLKG